MAFTGFTDQTFTFLRQLGEHNEKPWFDENRETYETHVKAPALDLIARLASDMAELSPALRAEPRVNGSLKRINRDVRFSKDKSPYNPRIHLVFWAGDHPNRSPGMHVVIHSDRIGFGAGIFGLDPKDLARHRNRIMDPAERSKLLEAEAQAGAVGCDWDGPELKNLPRGFEAKGEWTHLLRRKCFIMRTQADTQLPGWIKTEAAADEILQLTRACLPLIAWLCEKG